MKKQKTQNKGITLIALVITIIVMLILVAVTISMAVNGGLFDYAGRAVGETKNALNAEGQLAEGGVKVGDTWYNSIDEYLATKGISGGGNKVETISKTEDKFIGYYADVDVDGEVDGVIYADLAFSKEGTWVYGYSYEAVAAENLKDYYVSQENYDGIYGSKPVLAPASNGENRFYIMELEPLQVDGIFGWSYIDSGRPPALNTTETKYTPVTSNSFGSGYSNTGEIIKAFNSGAKYEDYDWAENIQLTSNNINYVINKYSQGWFIPSLSELDAFADVYDLPTEVGGYRRRGNFS